MALHPILTVAKGQGSERFRVLRAVWCKQNFVNMCTTILSELYRYWRVCYWRPQLWWHGGDLHEHHWKFYMWLPERFPRRWPNQNRRMQRCVFVEILFSFISGWVILYSSWHHTYIISQERNNWCRTYKLRGLIKLARLHMKHACTSFTAHIHCITCAPGSMILGYHCYSSGKNNIGTFRSFALLINFITAFRC